jgi:anti-anti-sigma factor
VDVRGEIDATNARDLGRFVERHAKASVQLILDLSEVQFFGTRGFATLYFIDVTCSRNDVDWMIVAGREVRRVLDICDPDGILPVADHRKFALTRLQHLARSWNRRPFSE